MKIGILAGGRGSRLRMGPKALVELVGVPIWRRMVNELSCLTLSPIMMVVPDGAPAMPGVEQIASGGKYLSDLLSLTQRKVEGEPLLIVNADAVLITAADIRGLLGEFADSPADFIWPVIERSAIWQERQSGAVTRYMPGTKNELAQSHLMYMPGTIRANMDVVECMNRHKLLADVIALGRTNVLKALTGRLKLGDIERRIGELLGCKAALVSSRNPNLAFDVDTPGDFKFAQQQLLERMSHA